MTAKWEQGRLIFKINSDMAWLKNVELFIVVSGPVLKIDFQSNIFGKELKFKGEMAEMDSLEKLKIEIIEPFTKFGKIILTAEHKKRYGF